MLPISRSIQRTENPSWNGADLFNLETNSAALRLVQQCLGLSELDQIYLRARAARHEGESIFSALLRVLQVSWNISPQDGERVPQTGGVIVVANHPFGMIEGVVLRAVLERIRPDVRVMANALLNRFSEVASSLILVDPFGGQNATLSNRQGLREALLWLKSGGMVGVFPAGEVASFDLQRKCISDPKWSPSIARLATLADVPVLPLFFAGHNGAAFQMAGLVHPGLRTALLAREFLNKTGKSLEIRIGNPVSQKKLRELSTDEDRVEYLRRKTYVLAKRDSSNGVIRYAASRHSEPSRPPRQEAIARATDYSAMEQEIAALPDNSLLDEQGENAVYVGKASRLPNVVREIGRLRELTFREAGEGTGRSTDLDEFDAHYLHLFIWNRSKREIVGAYRAGESELILKNFGRRGFYTSTLFAYGRRFLERISPALELGRSFVRIEYQKSYAPLVLLWRGIGALVSRNPQYRTLFGPVSISNSYHPGSKELMVSFLKEYCRASDLAHLVRARNPFRTRPLKNLEFDGASAVWDIEELSALVADIETDQKGVPILLKQYLKLGGRLVSFNVDSSFSNALDGLIVVDLLKTDQALLERYLGKEGTAGFLRSHQLRTA
jgi:putative hemolysin